MTTTTTADCICNSFTGACKVRIARGLVPFCRMPDTAPTAREGFTSFAEAAEAALAQGKKTHFAGGGGTSGSPARWILR